jgi:collagenase-like PrtC family protease
MTMELIVHIRDPHSLAAVLDQGAGGVAVTLPRRPDAGNFSELRDWRQASRERGVNFYLVWDWLLEEKDLPAATEMLAAVDRLHPDGVQVRDLGLAGEARRLFPDLPLQAAENWGAYNSPGIKLAQALGFSRVVMEGRISLKDLALARRQTPMPLIVTLPPFCQGYAHLCLIAEFLIKGGEACCLSRPESYTPQVLGSAIETFSGLCQLGVEAAQIRGELFDPAALAQVIQLYQSVLEASPVERPRVVAAAREILEAFGEGFMTTAPPAATLAIPWVRPQTPSLQGATPSRPEFLPRYRIWLEARDYAEAMVLSHEWREALLVPLTPDNYSGFLQDHRHWTPRRLIWRLPPLIRESSLAFYPKALETIIQGGFSRFVAGDWGAVALIHDMGGQVYGDQTLGVHNSWAVKAAQELRVARVCLPPGQPGSWQDLLKVAPSGTFWGYLYQVAPLAVCPAAAAGAPPLADLRWVSEDGKSILALKTPQDHRNLVSWFKQLAISPLVVSLPRSYVRPGKLPSWLSAPPQTSHPGK